MAHAQKSGRPDVGPASSGIGRRRVLVAGAACCIPVIVGAGVTRAVCARAETPRPQGPESDPILDHVQRELAKAAREMNGVRGPKGEHVRVLASNLGLMAAYLVRERLDGAARTAVEEGLARFGRDCFVRELSDGYLETTAAEAERLGIRKSAHEDLEATGLALDAVANEDVSVLAEAAVPRLLSLARRMDRVEGGQDAAARLVGWRLVNYPDDVVGDGGELNCKGLKNLIYYFGVVSTLFGMAGQVILAGIFALYAILSQAVYDEKCAGQEEMA